MGVSEEQSGQGACENTRSRRAGTGAATPRSAAGEEAAAPRVTAGEVIRKFVGYYKPY